ncbi:unnamed protein product [Kluyveromyces dobzhanskii CBS 2104]|uniref:WGS project CCBQ000000000 data, contig 00008 n=1 Tax=Kluyveromyces dobzhanskii CBS 2104 TaxID=1427455 RepID=A0A0A8L9M3_9SACH|nr:unnamed protein product [Kluyveromyces dobzhanskii CBS 2104]
MSGSSVNDGGSLWKGDSVENSDPVAGSANTGVRTGKNGSVAEHRSIGIGSASASSSPRNAVNKNGTGKATVSGNDNNSAVNEEQDNNNDDGQNVGGYKNHNNSMLNFNDDYTSILNNLTNGNSNSSDKIQQESPKQDKSTGGMDKGSLDMLLQHYQELLNRSSSAVNSPQFNPSGVTNGTPSPSVSSRPLATDKPCDHCRRRQTECLVATDSHNCIPCDAKGIKCTFSELPSGKVAADVLQKMNKRDRVDENINVHELLKRTKFNSNNSNSRNNNSGNNSNINSTDNQNSGDNNNNNNNNNSNNNSHDTGNNPSSSHRTPNNEITSDNANALPIQYYNDAIQSWYKSQTNTDQPPYPYQKNVSDFNNNAGQKGSPSSVYDLSQYNYGSNTSHRQPPSVSSGHQNIQRQINYAQPSIQYPRSSYFVGPTSIFDINLINHMKLDKIEQVQLSQNVALRKVSPNVQFILRDDFNQDLYLKQERDIDLVEKLVHPHGKILVEIFFKLIHPYFPILHEHVFLEKYSRSYRELTAPILASIYSLALQWWDFHPQLIGFPKPDVVTQLNDIALKTFYEVFERPKLSIVQAGLLILHCRSERPNNWVLCSEVVALSEELGLGVDCQDWRLPRWERGLRRRLAWAVWCQDKWTALLESRNSHLILGRNWMVKLLTEDDFPDKSPIISSSQRNKQPSHRPMSPFGNTSILDISPTDEDFNNGKVLFRQMVSLSIILGEIMDTFYTIGAIKTTTKIEHVLKLAKPLQLKLREWYHSLPHKLSMSNYCPGSYNSNATLTLAYFSAEITLHRKIISTLSPDSPAELITVCRTAAKTRLVAAIEFIRDLKTEHINSFWYTSSTGNLALIGTFSALLYVTAPAKDEALFFRDCLRNYIWILRMSSRSFERAGNALDRIHMLLTRIPGLLTDEATVQPFVPPKSQSPYNPSPSFNHSHPSSGPTQSQQHQQHQQQHQQQQQQQHHSQQHTQGNSQQQFFNSQSPYYGSPHASYENMNSAAFKQLKNLPPEILQSLSNIQANMPSVPSASFTELNELLEAHSKTPKTQTANSSSNFSEPVSEEKSPVRSIPLIISDKAKSNKNPITPSSAAGTNHSNESPRKDLKPSPTKSEGGAKTNTPSNGNASIEEAEVVRDEAKISNELKF